MIVAFVFYGSVFVTDVERRHFPFLQSICSVMRAGVGVFSSASLRKLMASVGIMGFPLDLLRNRHSTLALPGVDRLAVNVGIFLKISVPWSCR